MKVLVLFCCLGTALVVALSCIKLKFSSRNFSNFSSKRSNVELVVQTLLFPTPPSITSENNRTLRILKLINLVSLLSYILFSHLLSTKQIFLHLPLSLGLKSQVSKTWQTSLTPIPQHLCWSHPTVDCILCLLPCTYSHPYTGMLWQRMLTKKVLN